MVEDDDLPELPLRRRSGKELMVAEEATMIPLSDHFDKATIDLPKGL